MDFIHRILNVVLPPLTLLGLVFFSPFYLVFKFFSCIKRRANSENVAGKVVLITGASSGIGEHIAYEYARRRARLALVARRECRLQEVASKAQVFGSPEVIVIQADVSKVEDCKRFVDETVRHYGKLDHLVNNAGIARWSMFGDSTQIGDFAPVMKTNFWGSVYATHFAVPYLKKSKGKIIVIASVAGWLTPPSLSIYNASKAALVSLYETLRIEFGSDIGITIVTPGLIESEITNADFILEGHYSFVPLRSADGCAKAIVNSACHGERHLTEPFWVTTVLLLKLLCPELVEWTWRFLLLSTRKNKHQ